MFSESKHLYVTREPVTSPTEGGSGGAFPPGIHTRTTITSKSPGEAIFIYYDVVDFKIWRESLFVSGVGLAFRDL